nr:replication initiation protein [Microvirus sp.]
MAVCYNRLMAWIPPQGGQLVFSAKRAGSNWKQVTVPCGHCMACRVNHSSQLATRIMHEFEYSRSVGCFVTLTYAPAHCPKDYAVKKDAVQKFIKRVRRYLEYHELGELRAFFACGEYGDERGRPHYHVLLLGWNPDDLVYHGKSYSGEPIYTSKTMESLWPFGFCPIGSLTRKSSGYVARYAKKCVGDGSSREKPFLLYSRNIRLTNGKCGSVGAQWCLDHMDELRRGFLVDHDDTTVKMRIPDYYFDLCERYAPDLYARIKLMRYDYAQESMDGWFTVGTVDGPSAIPGPELLAQDALAKSTNDLVHYLHLDKQAADRTLVLRERARVQEASLSTLLRRLHHGKSSVVRRV